MTEPQPVRVWPAVRRLLRLSGRQQVRLYAAMGLSLLEGASNILFALWLARAIDAAIAGEQSLFVTNALIAVAISAAGIPCSMARAWALGSFSERTMASLREAIARRTTELPMAYLDERHTGDMLALLNADLARVQALLGKSLLTIVSQAALALGSMAALISISWQLALVSTLLMPVMFVVMSRLSAPVAQRSQSMQEELGRTMSVAQDILSGLMVTRVFSLGATMDARFRESNRRTMGHGLALAWLQALTGGVAWAFSITPFIVCFGLGGWLAIHGSLTFGRLSAFIQLMNNVANPMGSIPPAIAGLGEAAGAAGRLFSLLDAAPERAGGALPDTAVGAPVVALQDISLSYGDDPVLAGVTFDVAAGQTVALVGASGSGKSTVLKLLLGFYPASSGTVSLLGTDLNEWPLTGARAQMAYMGQDPYLFPVTLGENIALGRAGIAGPPTRDEIEQAARMADIHDEIMALPQGYDTPAGERGARLSGGQRQRLALARAILRDAPLLLLDEPTAALDAESEAQVQAALERFMDERTTLVVAHRLATIRDADRILVLDEGRIVEQGTHAELMALGGRYRRLYERQVAGSGAGETCHE